MHYINTLPTLTNGEISALLVCVFMLYLCVALYRGRTQHKHTYHGIPIYRTHTYRMHSKCVRVLPKRPYDWSKED